MPEVLHETTPRARKAHRCSLCAGEVTPGERYTRKTLVHDGRVYDWLGCHGCVADRVVDAVRADGYGDRYEGVNHEDALKWAQTVGDPIAQRFLARTSGALA